MGTEKLEILAALAMAGALWTACSSDQATAGSPPGAGGASTGGAAGAGGSAQGGAGGAAANAGAGGGAGGAQVEAGAGAAGAPEAGEDAPPEAGDGACNNNADLAIIADQTALSSSVADCAKKTMGAAPATKDCIVQKTGLSDGCAQCFADSASCIIKNCAAQCMLDPNSPTCVDCRASKCDPAFEVCSGVSTS